MSESSTATMTMTNNEYSTFTTLLSASKALITTLERADFLDRLILLAALTFFGLVCVYVFKRRVVDKGVRVATALGNVVARKGKGKEEVVEEILAVTTAIVSSLLSIATILPSSSSVSIQHGASIDQVTIATTAPLPTTTKKLSEREKIRESEREKGRERAEERERRRAQNGGGKMGRVTREARVPRDSPSPSSIVSVESVVEEVRTMVEEASSMETAVPVEATQETVAEQVESTVEEIGAPEEEQSTAASPVETVTVVEASEEVAEQTEEPQLGFVGSIVDEIRSALPDFIVETPHETDTATEEPEDDSPIFSASAEPESEPTLDIPSPTPSPSPIPSLSTLDDETTTLPPPEPTPESSPSAQHEKNPKSRRFEGEEINPALWSHESVEVKSTAIEEAEEASTTFEVVTTPIDLPTPTPVYDAPIESLQEVILTASEEPLHPREDAVEGSREVEEEIATQRIDEEQFSGNEVVNMEVPETIIEMLEEDAAASNVEPPPEEQLPIEATHENAVEDATPVQEMGNVAMMEELMRETRASWAEIISHTDPNDLEPELLLKNHPVAEGIVEESQETEEDENASPVVADEQVGEIDLVVSDEEEIPAPAPASAPSPTFSENITDDADEEEAPAATPASTPEIEHILQADDLLASEAIADAEPTNTIIGDVEESLFDVIDEESAEAEIGGSLISDPSLYAEHNPFNPDPELETIIEPDTPDDATPEHAAPKLTDVEVDELAEMEAEAYGDYDGTEGASPVEVVEERMRDEL